MGGTAQVTPAPANTQPQPPVGILHEVIAPDGTHGTSSSAELQGLPDGYKVTGRLRMYAPDGKRGYADPEALAELTRAGYRLTPETQFQQERNPKNQPGFWESVGSTLANQAEGAASDAKNYVLGPIEDATAVYKASRKSGAGVLPSAAKAAVPAMFDPEVHQVLGSVNAVAADQQRKTEGRSLPYRIVAPAVAQATGVNLPDVERAADVGNRAGIVAGTGVPAAELLASEVGGRVAKLAPVQTARESLAEGMARPTLERTLSKTKADAQYGHVPERAIVREKITTAEDAEAKLKDLGKRIDTTLNKPEYVNKTIDVKNIVMQNARGAIADARRAGNPGAVNRIIQVRDAMLSQYGKLAKSPRAAAKMKTDLYGDVKWTGAEHESEVNGFRKAVAGQIRDEVNKAAPEVKELNQRYGDAAAAKEALERSEMLRSNRGMTTRLKEGAVAQGTRKIAQVIGKQYERPGPGITAQRNAAGGGITRGGGGGNGTPPGPGITRAPSGPPGPGVSPRELPSGGGAKSIPLARQMADRLRLPGAEAPEARPLTDRRMQAAPERRVQEQSPPSGTERRQTSRRISDFGPSLTRSSLAASMKEIVADPASTPRDIEIAKAQLADLQANPFEQPESTTDINKVRSAQQLVRSGKDAGKSGPAPAGMTQRSGRASAIRIARERAERIRKARLVPSS